MTPDAAIILAARKATLAVYYAGIETSPVPIHESFVAAGDTLVHWDFTTEERDAAGNVRQQTPADVNRAIEKLYKHLQGDNGIPDVAARNRFLEKGLRVGQSVLVLAA